MNNKIVKYIFSFYCFFFHIKNTLISTDNVDIFHVVVIQKILLKYPKVIIP